MSLLLPFVLAAASLSQGPFETPAEPTAPVNCPEPPATIRTEEGRVYECRLTEGEAAYRDVTPPDENTHWGPFETLPEPLGQVNCPEPPATISTVEGRIYECRPEEGEDAYRDVTPPDEKTHWMLTFGSARLPPNGTGSYRPVEDWPFRAIVSSRNPAAPGAEYFYVFDRRGVVIDSNEAGAVGDQMMEVRISEVRLWPAANVYYRMPPPDDKAKHKWSNPIDRIRDTAFYALVVDGKMLCPVLDESLVSNWPGEGVSPAPTGTYINGHCGETTASRATG